MPLRFDEINEVQIMIKRACDDLRKELTKKPAPKVEPKAVEKPEPKAEPVKPVESKFKKKEV